MSRRASLSIRNPDDPLLFRADVGAFGYLIDFLFEVGPVQGGEFRSPISFTEIKSWSELTKIDLDPDEVLVLRRLSLAYLEGLSDDSPFSPRNIIELTTDHKKQVSDTLKNHLRSLASTNSSNRRKK